MMSSRTLTVAAAQLGAIQLATPRSQVINRMLKLLDRAKQSEVRLVVFPELALTTFFPRHIIQDPGEVAKYFEPESAEDPAALLKNDNTRPLFHRARDLGIDISFGYGERWSDKDGKLTDYNTMIYYSAKSNAVLAKYRKVHLPGTKEPVRKPDHAEQLEKMFFAPGDLGFQAFRVPGLVDGTLTARDGDATPQSATEGQGDPILGMLLCNDRRWPEAWRCYGLQGVELVLEGYNTCGYAPQRPGTEKEQEELAVFHHRLSCQAGSYQNACFSIHCAKAGYEDGGLLIASSMIVAPSGRVIAESTTSDDELVVAQINLADCRYYKEGVFNFEKHRRVEHYGRIVEQTGVQEVPLLAGESV
ncbi:n-carbamyl-d-amino acid amidohydrolase [Aspergillus steynii IBT 23096]|uniref:N-carbamyl-d-amino acid amidohydrolase n=1 Tax=Aspergillus steynii IBT 23096 TaxID=1392250 RepID=A0A2I2FUB1_9EURO|nr:n-carbamyl-d-amino acid amidohydrolase [Aspergillus steynii IBT 23096]PLB44212.1 n-carbamyl-d-amino acid amidohydrolase [Aspergillus steynii IBT 23096]